MRIPLLLAAAALLAAPAPSQLTLTTTFADNNGLSAGAAQYFDITVLNPAGVAISQLDVNSNSTANTSGTLDIYLTAVGGTYVGNETNAGLWSLAGSSQPFLTAGRGLPTAAPLATPIVLAAGRYGIAIHYVGVGVAYTNGNGTNQQYANQDLQLDTGSSSSSLFGGSYNNPRVWNGTVYYTPGSGSYAQATPFGSGCGHGGPASFYEVFSTTHPFDLSGLSFTMVWTGVSYALIPGASATVAPSGSALTITDDTVVPLTLPWPMPTQAGTTQNVWLSSNGFLTFESNTSSQLSESVSLLLGDPLTRLAFLWDDLNPGAAGTVHAEQDPSTPSLYHITFRGVPEYSNSGSNDVQVSLQQGGAIEVKYGNCTIADCLVGYSPGHGAQDPGATDVSALQGMLLGDGRPDLALASLARPILGQTAQIELRNLPIGGLAGVVNYGFEIPTPLDLTPVGAPGCWLYVSALAGVGFPLTQSTARQSLPLPGNPAFARIVIGLQGVVLMPGINQLGVAATNGLRWTLDVN
ncbi:MAG: hypothetical protein IPM29_15555 [Planctomycetes bacterium]|nr:hypothetical protein [Planctomycetota bacterium]